MKNNQPQVILSDQQKQLVAELVGTYGIEASEVTFFTGDTRPFLSYEATCIVASELLNLRDIDIVPIESGFIDSFSLKCTLTLPNGHTRSNVGVANVKELIDGQPMGPQQLFALASSRAIRNTLRTAGFDLIKLHLSRGDDETTYTGQPKTNRAALIAQAHALGTEVGFIVGDNKAGWKRLLWHRYGQESSAALREDNLADLVAALRAISAQSRAAA